MFFAPIVDHVPLQPETAHVVVVESSQPTQAAASRPVPPALRAPVTVPQSYQYGACQAIHRIAWELSYQFSGDCTKYNRINPLPLQFGAQAPASDWLDALAQQLPKGVQVSVDVDRRSISVSP
jgi:hypothetical protein